MSLLITDERLSMKISPIYAFVLSFICSQSIFILKADFIAASMWSKIMPTGQEQRIVFIGDEHSTQNPQQVKDLLDSIPTESLALIEDRAEKCKKISLKFSDCNLMNLTSKIKAQSKSIKAINIEFRASDSCESVLASDTFCQTHEHLNQYLDDIKKWQQKSSHYNDNPEFNAIYSKLRLDMKEMQSYLKSLNQKLKNACAKNNSSNFDMQIGHLKTIKQVLHFMMISSIAQELDIRALHQIYKHQDKKFIFVVVGAEHKKNMELVMNSLGYNRKISISTRPHQQEWNASNSPLKNFLTAACEQKNNIHPYCALSTVCMMRTFVYAPMKWQTGNNKWYTQPTYKNPFSGFKQSTAQWMKKSFVPTMPFRNFTTKISAMPRCFKVADWLR